VKYFETSSKTHGAFVCACGYVVPTRYVGNDAVSSADRQQHLDRCKQSGDPVSHATAREAVASTGGVFAGHAVAQTASPTP